MGSARVRLRAAQVLIVLGACLAIAGAVAGAWLTAMAMVLVIAGQIPVYRGARRELSGRE